MGKRKLHNTSFWQCEWTGFPLKVAHCYMPTWSPAGKLVKKGSYCNWEAVVAHADELEARGEMLKAEHARVCEHVEYVTGLAVQPAPHYTDLMHTKGHLTAVGFHEACVRNCGPITAVKIASNGDVFEVLVVPQKSTGTFNFDLYMHKPYNLEMGLSSFHSMRKKGQSKGTDRDLTVWYYATKELPHNPLASNMFKMQLYGDVLLVQQSREASFLPRERYVSFNKELFDEQFCKKRRKTAAEPPSLTPDAYADLKEQMQKTLNQFEKTTSAAAVAPREMSKSVHLPPTSGKSLAEKVRARQ
jgi:hypothetical protein